MAVIYLRSTDGSDSDNGSTWALAKATLAAALTAAGAGGTVYVSDNHAETQATAMTLTSPGTADSMTRVLCVDDSAEPPTALATTATVSTTVGSDMSFVGFAYFYGITFNCGNSSSSAHININATTPRAIYFDACSLRLNGSSASSRIFIGTTAGSAQDDQLVYLNNTTMHFGNASQAATVQTLFRWQNTPSAVGGTLPTTLFLTLASPVIAEIRGVDLSALGSGKTLVNMVGVSPGRFLFENCKLGSSVTITTGAIAGQGGVGVRLVNCASDDTNYRYYAQAYQGEIFHEATIVRTGGASDGTTPISRKMVTTANSRFESPLESDPMVFWNETVGSSVTATVEVVTDNVTLTDAEAWVEVEYLGTSGFPLSLFAHDRATNILSTPVNQTSSSVTWTTTGLGTPVKQKLSVSFTPQEKGPVKVKVMLAKASTTMYFCPLVDVS